MPSRSIQGGGLCKERRANGKQVLACAHMLKRTARLGRDNQPLEAALASTDSGSFASTLRAREAVHEQPAAGVQSLHAAQVQARAPEGAQAVCGVPRVGQLSNVFGRGHALDAAHLRLSGLDALGHIGIVRATPAVLSDVLHADAGWHMQGKSVAAIVHRPL